MKIGQFRKINQFFGIAKINQENEEWFVIYYNKFDFLMQNELGDVIGKGKTEEEAFSSALLNLYKNQKSIEKILKKIQALHTSIENHHPVIFPMKLYSSEQNQESGICSGGIAKFLGEYPPSC